MRINRQLILNKYKQNPGTYRLFSRRYESQLFTENLNESTKSDIVSALDTATKKRQKIQPIYVYYLGFDTKALELKFKVTSGTKKGVYWFQRIRIKDLKKSILAFKNDKNYKQSDWIDLILGSDIEVHCNCPAYKYYWQNIATELDYAIEKEDRPANIRNPSKKGSVCKHLAKVLIYMPNNRMDILKDLKKAFNIK